MTRWKPTKLHVFQRSRNCGSQMLATKTCPAVPVLQISASGICPCQKKCQVSWQKNSSTALSCGVSVALPLSVWERHKTSAGGTGHEKSSKFLKCLSFVPHKWQDDTGCWSTSLWCSVLCEQWLVCHPCSRFLTLTVLYSHVSVAGHQPTAVCFGKAETPFWRCEHLQCTTSFIVETGNCWMHRCFQHFAGWPGPDCRGGQAGTVHNPRLRPQRWLPIWPMAHAILHVSNLVWQKRCGCHLATIASHVTAASMGMEKRVFGIWIWICRHLSVFEGQAARFFWVKKLNLKNPSGLTFDSFARSESKEKWRKKCVEMRRTLPFHMGNQFILSFRKGVQRYSPNLLLERFRDQQSSTWMPRSHWCAPPFSSPGGLWPSTTAQVETGNLAPPGEVFDGCLVVQNGIRNIRVSLVPLIRPC